MEVTEFLHNFYNRDRVAPDEMNYGVQFGMPVPAVAAFRSNPK